MQLEPDGFDANISFIRSNNKQQATNNKQQTTNDNKRQQTTNNKERTTNDKVGDMSMYMHEKCTYITYLMLHPPPWFLLVFYGFLGVLQDHLL